MLDDKKTSQITTIDEILLTNQHMMVIKLLQNFYKEFNLLPSTRAIINYANLHTPDLQLNSILFAKLFPAGIAQACTIANLPASPRCL